MLVQLVANPPVGHLIDQSTWWCRSAQATSPLIYQHRSSTHHRLSWKKLSQSIVSNEWHPCMHVNCFAMLQSLDSESALESRGGIVSHLWLSLQQALHTSKCFAMSSTTGDPKSPLHHWCSKTLPPASQSGAAPLTLWAPRHAIAPCYVPSHVSWHSCMAICVACIQQRSRMLTRECDLLLQLQDACTCCAPMHSCTPKTPGTSLQLQLSRSVDKALDVAANLQIRT